MFALFGSRFLYVSVCEIQHCAQLSARADCVRLIIWCDNLILCTADYLSAVSAAAVAASKLVVALFCVSAVFCTVLFARNTLFV